MTTNQRAYNFNAGPAALPLSVLEQAQQEFLNYAGTGMSIVEMSHRSKEYEALHNEAIQNIRSILDVPADYEVVFVQGGGSTQFSMVPMNFLAEGQEAGYVLTGSWAEKAKQAAEALGTTYVAASDKENQYKRIPALQEIQVKADSAYLHLTSNNTIYGTQWQDFPDTGKVPLIADMSSDILSRPIPVEKFALIYAGAQKNLGPSGVTLVLIRKDLLEQKGTGLSAMLNYTTYVKNNSLYNTPPVFSIYMLGLTLKWIQAAGGLKVLHKRNQEKAALIYQAIDNSQGFYYGHAEKNSRSLMNITFRLKDESLEKEFLTQAKQEGFIGVAGHRSVGGCRVSTYNAVPAEACQALSDFMKEFQKKQS